MSTELRTLQIVDREQSATNGGSHSNGHQSPLRWQGLVFDGQCHYRRGYFPPSTVDIVSDREHGERG